MDDTTDETDPEDKQDGGADEETEGDAPASAADDTTDTTDPEDKKAGGADEETEGDAPAAKAARKQERARIAAILGSEEAKGREEQALYFALETEMSPKAAVKALAVAHKGQVENVLSVGMRSVSKPSIGPGGKAAQESNESPIVLAMGKVSKRALVVGKRGA
ncbi:MAG: hypothetical protein GC153_13070 [Alphaproteobacteria bacterium]|nr:hypothetical protein [Alphaproteobacteria bacterium]